LTRRGRRLGGASGDQHAPRADARPVSGAAHCSDSFGADDEPAADPREWRSLHPQPRSTVMSESVYRVTELVETSIESWEEAAQVAIETAASSLRDLRHRRGR